NNGNLQGGRDIRLAFNGTNPVIASQMVRNNLGQTVVNGVYLTDLWVSTSSNGGTTWTTPVQLPDDGNRALQFPITLAVGPQGQAAVSAYDNGGNQTKVLCGWPKLMQSTDLVNWTHCDPGNSPGP